MRIGHYAPQLWAPGGIATYVRRLGVAQADHGHEVFYLSRDATGTDERVGKTRRVAGDADLFRQATVLDLDVLHLHKSVTVLPDDRVPTVRTMHGHQGSCPSASRYLARTGRPCNRVPSLGGCLVGHVLDRCGSVRPRQLAANFARLRHEVESRHEIAVEQYFYAINIEGETAAPVLELFQAQRERARRHRRQPVGPLDRGPAAAGEQLVEADVGDRAGDVLGFVGV